MWAFTKAGGQNTRHVSIIQSDSRLSQEVEQRERRDVCDRFIASLIIAG